MSAAHTPGPWLLVYVKNKAGAQRIAVARQVSGKLEYVCSASGKRSTFSTEAGAKFARNAVIAKATGSIA